MIPVFPEGVLRGSATREYMHVTQLSTAPLG